MVAISNYSLKSQLHPLITRLANCILEIWQQTFDLNPYQLPDDLGYVEGRLEDETLIIENQCFQTVAFRKMHLELARAGTGIEVLHCVMFPHLTYGLPLFGCDVVAARGQVSAAIVDLSPVVVETETDPLPAEYAKHLDPWRCQHTHFRQPRELPEWGQIFSPYCLFVRPDNESELDLFIEIASHYLKIHCQLSLSAPAHPDPEAVYAGQYRYCTQQQQNDRTRRILEKAFGSTWADRYMTTVLFDLPPAPSGVDCS